MGYLKKLQEIEQKPNQKPTGGITGLAVRGVSHLVGFWAAIDSTIIGVIKDSSRKKAWPSDRKAS
jgi:hypothetical protein